ncbi:MAG TPA: hypothetical protein ENG87_05980 [Candidatus Pacearchaeota archaeon]|nr:hypothetical protein [Candidatus Pacearchaeota archaeon]
MINNLHKSPYVNDSVGFTLLLISNNIVHMDIIIVLDYIEANPDSDSNNLSADLNISKNDASVRLFKLKRSHLIRETNDKKPFKYKITLFGKRYLKYKRENPDKKKQWHGLIPKNHR